MLHLAVSSEKHSGRIGVHDHGSGRKTGNVVVRRATPLTSLAPTHHNCQARGRVSSSYF